MSADLTVHTPLIRQAAAELDEVSAVFAVGAEVACPLTDGSLGSSAVAREVVLAASRRVAQSVETSTLLANQALEAAGRLRASAAAFDAAESSAIGPPR